MSGTNFFPSNGPVRVALTNEFGQAMEAECTVANIPSGVPNYAVGCEIIATDTGAHYYNTGTALSASFVVGGTVTAGSVGTSELANGGVTLAKLASGITPSHVVKFAGTSSAFGGGGTTFAITVTGALSTDVATAVIRASTNSVSVNKATLTTDTLTIIFSADPGAATTIDYSVLRAAA